MNGLVIFLIIIFILIFLSLFVVSGVIVSSKIDPGPIPIPPDPTPIPPDPFIPPLDPHFLPDYGLDLNTTIFSGKYTIENKKLNYLQNFYSMAFTHYNPIYIEKINNTGIILQPGLYEFNITFNILEQNYTGNQFNCYLLLSTTYNSEQYTYYNLVSNGPKYLDFSQIGFCEGTDNVSFSSYSRQYGQDKYYGTLSPFIVFGYQCKSSNTNICDSNYYGLSFTINVENVETYYFSTAFDKDGSYMNGSGKFEIKLLDT